MYAAAKMATADEVMPCMLRPLGSSVSFEGWGEGTAMPIRETDEARYSPLRPPTVDEELSATRALASADLEAS